MLTSDPSFRPPFCPNPRCDHHRDSTGWTWHLHGTHSRKAWPHLVQRYRCTHCKRTFSSQTFATTYWLKRPDLQKAIFDGLAACSGHRQLGRSLGVAATTVERQSARLGRHCLLFQQAHAPRQPPSEDLELDGLVSFEFSQYWPFEINTLVGAVSYFVYGFSESELRRSGRMRPDQKVKRAELEKAHGRPHGQATRDAVVRLVQSAVPQASRLAIRSDEHAAYPRAFRRLPHDIHHSTVSSRRCRTIQNPLFAVDLLDLLVRHGSSNHKRETIAFSKRRQAAMERFAVLQVWRNFQKRKVEANLRSPTPAQILGLAPRRLTTEDILERRLFPSRIDLPDGLQDCYWRRIPTRQMPNARRHQLKLAA